MNLHYKIDRDLPGKAYGNLVAAGTTDRIMGLVMKRVDLPVRSKVWGEIRRAIYRGVADYRDVADEQAG